MNNTLPTRLQHLLAAARGLSELRFDDSTRISNWPENIANEVKQLIELLQTSGNDVELRACADMINVAAPTGVPAGLLRMLSQAIFDNPNTPLRKN
jgi:hypothetical protein